MGLVGQEQGKMGISDRRMPGILRALAQSSLRFHVPQRLPLQVTAWGEAAFSPWLGTPGDHILVTKSYDDMFHRLLRLRQEDKGRTRGAVLTGWSDEIDGVEWAVEEMCQ